MQKAKKILFNTYWKFGGWIDTGDYLGKLSDCLKGGLKSSKDERDMLVEILAVISVLKTTSTDCPQRGKYNWIFAQYWCGEDGICNVMHERSLQSD